MAISGSSFNPTSLAHADNLAEGHPRGTPLQVVDLPRQINSEVDSDEAQELLDSHNRELTIDELTEMHEQKQDIEEPESVDPVQSEDRMTVGNLTEAFRLIEKWSHGCIDVLEQNGTSNLSTLKSTYQWDGTLKEARTLASQDGILTVFGGPSLSLEIFPVALKTFIHIKTHFRPGIRRRGGISKGRRKACCTVMTDRPLDKYTSTAKMSSCLDHNMYETGTSKNINIPLYPFHRTPPHDPPFPTNITATSYKTGSFHAPACIPHWQPARSYIHFYLQPIREHPLSSQQYQNSCQLQATTLRLPDPIVATNSLHATPQTLKSNKSKVHIQTF
ncbi:hypothetical protein TNCV_1030101 [Trichonephila clavipes]|nr:hypothetical protein TNCV_1030101 [Trichonephila clavipes]